MQQRVDMMYVHALDPLKGWFQLSALDKSAKFDPSVISNGIAVYPGRCVFCNDAGYFTPDKCSTASNIGGLVTASRCAMPIFLWAGTTDADVLNDGTALSQSISGTPIANWIPVQPSGDAMGLVATGGYELQTTEYDTSTTVSYIPNRPLTVINGNSTASRGTATTVNGISYYPNVGLLTSNSYTSANTALTPFTDLIVGICSPFTQGQVNYLQPTNLTNSATNTSTGYNANGMTVLSFWTHMIPGASDSY